MPCMIGEDVTHTWALCCSTLCLVDGTAKAGRVDHSICVTGTESTYVEAIIGWPRSMWVEVGVRGAEEVERCRKM